MLPTCKHCLRKPANRPRGLCWTCFYTPGIKVLYGPVSNHGRRGPGNFFMAAPLPSRPTAAKPGSRMKLEALAERVNRRESLWHPDDAE